MDNTKFEADKAKRKAALLAQFEQDEVDRKERERLAEIRSQQSAAERADQDYRLETIYISTAKDKLKLVKDILGNQVNNPDAVWMVLAELLHGLDPMGGGVRTVRQAKDYLDVIDKRDGKKW